MAFAKWFLFSLALGSMPALAGDFSRDRCALPEDQGAGSFIGAWADLPITLVFDREFYRLDEGRPAKAMKRAVQTWNEWAERKGKVAFNIAHEGEGMEIPGVDGCAQSLYTEALPGTVGVWMIGRNGDHANRRESCGRDESGVPNRILAGVPAQTDWETQDGKIAGASVLLNFDDFNTPGKPKFDLEGLFLHHLGHVLGLLHSCNGSDGDVMDATTAPLCSEAPGEYRHAVMAPDAWRGIERELQKNDYERVNCLY
jgi:hypothetical protein